MRRVMIIVAGAMLAVACSTSLAPRAIRSGEVCYRCRRAIVNERLAAQMITGGLYSNYRSAACLAKYLADHKDDNGTIFVTDFASGKLFPVEQAFFVPTKNRDNGEEDFVAYRDQAAADSEARTQSSTVVRWTTVLERARS